MDFKKLMNSKTPEIKPYVSIDGMDIDIKNIAPGIISLEQYEKVRANTPGFRLLYAKLNNEALIEAVKNNLKNCTHPFSPSVYEYALQNYLVPELIKRLKEMEELRKENLHYRDRLQISPFGDDKIDELEEAIEHLRFRLKNKKRES